MTTPRRTCAAAALHLSVFFFLGSFFCSRSSATGRVLSGDFEYGEKYTDVFETPDEAMLSQDDGDFDRYSFKNAWFQYEQPLKKSVRVSVRTQQTEKNFSERSYLNSTTRYGQVRLSIEPSEGWAVWPHVSYRSKNYVKDVLDNDAIVAGCEARYRWGTRNNVRFGGSWSSNEYELDSGKDRTSGAAFVSYERPVFDGFTVRVGARAEQTSFRVQSATRENSTRGSASVGFRYEF